MGQTLFSDKAHISMVRHSEVHRRWKALAFLAVLVASGPCVYAQSGVVKFTEAFRIGDEAAGDSVLLDRVFTMAVDSREQLYLTDFGFKGIRMFSKDGVLIGEIGRVGRGPGEFAGPPSVYIGPGDSLYAWDRQTTRLSIFTPQGQSLITSVTVRHSEFDALRPLAFLGATNRGLLMEFSSFYPPGSGESGEMAHLVQLVYWSGTTATDTIAHLPSPDYVIFEMESASGVRFLPYAAHPHFEFSADQVLYYGMGDAIDITGMPLNGGKRHRISLPHRPVFLAPAERLASVAGVRLNDLRKKLLANIPAHKPAFSKLLLDDAGHLWIRLSRPESEQTTMWLVLDNTGVEVARANVPKGMRLLAVHGSRAYGELTDEDTKVPVAVAWEISF